MSGKGSTRRIENTQKIRDNWDAIFGKNKSNPIEYLDNKIKELESYPIDPNRRTVDDIYEEWFTKSENTQTLQSDVQADIDKINDNQHQSSIH